jgi:hypothetical protein
VKAKSSKIENKSKRNRDFAIFDQVKSISLSRTPTHPPYWFIPTVREQTFTHQRLISFSVFPCLSHSLAFSFALFLFLSLSFSFSFSVLFLSACTLIDLSPPVSRAFSYSLSLSDYSKFFQFSPPLSLSLSLFLSRSRLLISLVLLLFLSENLSSHLSSPFFLAVHQPSLSFSISVSLSIYLIHNL